MARKPTHVYLTLAMEKGSPMYCFYEEEAHRRGIRLPTHLVLLLRERYEHLTMQEGTGWLPPAREWPSSSSPPHTGRKEEDILPEESPVILSQASRKLLSTYGGEDEDE